MTDYLANACPKFAAQLRKRPIASLPTPVSHHDIDIGARHCSLLVKHDELTSTLYAGNKVRKLEYLLQRALDRGAERIATFGTVGSNHALATALHAAEAGLACTCFLSHQRPTASIRKTLDMHLMLGTELLYYGTGVKQLELLRRTLQYRNTWVIPLGGSCWLGALGFVNAGLELAAQIETGELAMPARIYLANGTMGSVAGLAIGLALAGLPIEIHAVQIVENRYTRRAVLDRLMQKTCTLLNRLDASIPLAAATRTKVVWRDDFLAGGYAVVDDATSRAVDFAASRLGLTLETTYTGKAMAALLHDVATNAADATMLFWNTYDGRALSTPDDSSRVLQKLPKEFHRYYD